LTGLEDRVRLDLELRMEAGAAAAWWRSYAKTRVSTAFLLPMGTRFQFLFPA